MYNYEEEEEEEEGAEVGIYHLVDTICCNYIGRFFCFQQIEKSGVHHISFITGLSGLVVLECIKWS